MHVESTCTGDLSSRKLLSDQYFCFEIICEIQIAVLEIIFNGQICALICFFFALSKSYYTTFRVAYVSRSVLMSRMSEMYILEKGI